MLAVLVLALACSSDASLDEPSPSQPEVTTGTTGDGLPALEGSGSSTSDASTGPGPMPDDPRTCPAECSFRLALDWVYEGAPSSTPSRPGTHAMGTMLREPSGTLTLGELRQGGATLHRLDRHGELQWNVPVPLPCDVCDPSHMARHPSGDLLVSASGWLVDGAFSLIAMRYDPEQHEEVWTTTRPLAPLGTVEVRSGDITALPDGKAAQLFMSAKIEFDLLQDTRMVVYDDEGLVVAEEHLMQGAPTQSRPPLLARADHDGTVVIGVFAGWDANLYGRIDRLAPPLWNPTAHASLPYPLDDLVVDDRGHALDVGHLFSGSMTHLVLTDRSPVSHDPGWVATMELPSTTASATALALGPDGDPYLAVRTTQIPAEGAAPLVGIGVLRWSPEGELRWSTSELMSVDDGLRPLALAIDDDDGVLLAAIVDDRLRVERRTQSCECG